MSDNLKGIVKPLPCPFCGAKPHVGLGKVWYDSLHGDKYQDTVVKCPHLCASMSGSADGVVTRWNNRVIPNLDAILAAAVREGMGVAAKAAFNACRASQSGYKDENSRLLQRAESEMRLETQKAIRTADADAITEAVKRVKETPDR